MPKSKKNKNKDFQKVKLKVGRKLPKADNETQTSFKSARIEIPNQLKGDSSQPTTKRKLSFKDLSTQLHHYSSSVRVGAVNGLRELFTSNPEIINENLALILEKSSTLFHDKDNLVREASIRLQRVILPQVSANQMAPFFPLISAHLCCAMTHIHDGVQMNSLSMLDLYLDLFPDFVVAQTMQILPNFIEQISRQSLNKTKSSRSLFVNPNSKLSTQKWRTQVLSRLMKILSTVIKGKSGDVVNDRIENKVKPVRWNAELPTYTPVFSASARLSWRSTGCRISSITSGETDVEADRSGGPSPSYISTLMPVMMECWLECLPEKNNDKGCIAHPDALSMMAKVLGVVQLLWRWISYGGNTDHSLAEWFHQQYFKECQKHFMGNFPYSVKVTSSLAKKTKKNSDSHKPQDISVLSVNLSVCEVMSRFLQQSNLKCLPSITDYLLDAMDTGELSSENHSTVLHVVNTLLPLLQQQGDSVNVDQLLDACWQLYCQAHPLSQQKRALLEWFSELALHQKWHTLQQQNVVKEFPRTLPKLLCELKRSSSTAELDKLIIQVIHKVCRQGDTTLLQPYLDEILNVKSGVLVTVSIDNQRDVIDLLYYIDHLDESQLKSIKLIVTATKLSKDNVDYLLNILFTRWQEGEMRSDLKSDLCSPAQFISFLLSVVLDISADDLEGLRDTSKSPLGLYTLFRPVTSDWTMQHHLAQHVVSLIQQSRFSEQIIEITMKFLDSVLNDITQLSYPSVLSVFVILNGIYCDEKARTAALMQRRTTSSVQPIETVKRNVVHITPPFFPMASVNVCVSALYDLTACELGECDVEKIPSTDYMNVLWDEIFVFSSSHGVNMICEMISAVISSEDVEVSELDLAILIKGVIKLLRALMAMSGYVNQGKDTYLQSMSILIQDKYPGFLSDYEKNWEEFKYYVSIINA